MNQFESKHRQSRRSTAVSARAATLSTLRPLRVAHPARTARGMSLRAVASAWLVLAMLLGVASQQATADASPARIDLNRANAEELETLPGIGASKAAAIVEFRAASGAFKRVEDLEEVRGIGPALIAKIRPLVKVGSKPRGKAGAKSGSHAAAKAPPTRKAGSGQ